MLLDKPYPNFFYFFFLSQTPKLDRLSHLLSITRHRHSPFSPPPPQTPSRQAVAVRRSTSPASSSGPDELLKRWANSEWLLTAPSSSSSCAAFVQSLGTRGRSARQHSPARGSHGQVRSCPGQPQELGPTPTNSGPDLGPIARSVGSGSTELKMKS